MSLFDVGAIVSALHEARDEWRDSQRRSREPGSREFPSRDALVEIVESLKGALFPMRLGPPDLRQDSGEHRLSDGSRLSRNCPASCFSCLRVSTTRKPHSIAFFDSWITEGAMLSSSGISAGGTSGSSRRFETAERYSAPRAHRVYPMRSSRRHPTYTFAFTARTIGIGTTTRVASSPPGPSVSAIAERRTYGHISTTIARATP